MSAQEQMLSKYGFPDGKYQAKFCVLWHIEQDFPWFPVTNIFLNKDFKEMLFKSFAAVQAAGLQGYIKVYNGCLVVRQVRGANSYSAHSWGSAIDLNAQEEPMFIADGLALDDPKRLGVWPKSFVDAMTSSGISFGGFFKHRSDPMHFAMLDM